MKQIIAVGSLFLMLASIGLSQTAQAPMLAPVVTVPGAKVEKVAGDFKFTEGCTADKDGNVYFVDQDNNRIMRWDATDGKVTEWMKPSNYSNGMTFDMKGNLIACADEKNEMWSIDIATKEHKVLLKDLDGKFLNGPNDVWVQPTSGRIYFTDPYYHRTWWKRGDRDPSEIPQCVYFLDPASGKVVRLIENIRQPDGTMGTPDGKHFRQPNGIIGTPDGKQLYVSDIGSRQTWVYDIKEDGTLANEKPFCAAGSDGMTIDSQGNVYLTRGTVQVFDKTGKKIQDIQVPEGPANVCFGGKDMQTLLITARTGFYSIKMVVKGVGPQ